MKHNSVMTNQELFSKVSRPQVERSTFNRSHGYKTTFDAGKLIPVFADEALPGDTMHLKTSIFGRLATPLKPIMDNIAIDVHYYSVPIRLVWDNFKKFMGEQENPGDTTDYIMPTMTSPAEGYAENSMMDYLGIPTKVGNLEHRSDFLRAIHLIYNEWFRDENHQDSLKVDKGDGPDNFSDYVNLLPRGKRKDYFTSCLPWAQKGDPVSIPIGTSAPVTGTATVQYSSVPTNQSLLRSPTSGGTHNSGTLTATATGLSVGGATAFLDPNGSLTVDAETNFTADLSDTAAATINQLREAFQIQRMFEKDARGGTRYTEMNLVHFGVHSPDARLQRPEYLGGGSSYVNVSPIAQQSATDSGTPQGNLAAIGTFSASNRGFTKSFTEHEIVIGFISARADLNYQQGLNRMWSRKTRFDHYFPSFAHLGEQAVLNKEIYSQGTDEDDDVFGYQERYAEYRYKPSMVTSLFRSNAAASLDVWHLSQDFDSLPQLNSSFIEEKPPIDRIIAVPSEPQFIIDCYFDLKHTRPMPTYSVPGMIDHF